MNPLAILTASAILAFSPTAAHAGLTPVNPTPETKVMEPVARTSAISTTYSQSIAASATRVGYRLHYTRSGAGVSVYGITFTSRIGRVPGFLCISGASRSVRVCPSYSLYGLGYQAFDYPVWNTTNGIATRAWDNGEPYGSSATKVHSLS